MTAINAHHQPQQALYELILDKCYRMNLLHDPVPISSLNPTLFQLEESIDNHIVQIILPGLQRILDRGLYDLYQALYTIDVSEEEFKERVMDIENTAMIPSVAAFMILDRLKAKYRDYPLLSNTNTSNEPRIYK